MTVPSHSNFTRKKLQFLKNSQLNPSKIKLSELNSFKRIGTAYQVNYCSSLKTVKDLREHTETNTSIESKQLLSEKDIESKRMIKIANRKMFEELVYDSWQMIGKESLKTKGKLKKEVKVRFHNIGQT